MVDFTDYIKARAAFYGIDPAVALKVAKSEGGTNQFIQSRVINKAGKQEPSFGPFQLLYGGGDTGSPEGMGNQMFRETGLDPRDPRNATAGIDFALQQAKQKGWGQWYGAKAAGLDNWAGIQSRGTTLTSGPRTVMDHPVVAVDDSAPAAGSVAAVAPPAAAAPVAPEAPGMWHQLAQGDLKGAWGTLKEGLKDAAAGDEDKDDSGATSLASTLTGRGSDTQNALDRENANIQTNVGASIGAEQAQRVQAAQQMMGQLLAAKKMKGKVPGLSMMG